MLKALFELSLAAENASKFLKDVPEEARLGAGIVVAMSAYSAKPQLEVIFAVQDSQFERFLNWEKFYVVHKR